MDELAKTEARNYLCAAGFFLLAGYFLLSLLSKIGSSSFVGMNDTINLAIGIGLLVCATLLIVLRKRDMIALFFFMVGFLQLIYAFTSSSIWYAFIIGFWALVALVTLTSKEKVKWLLFIIPLISFIYSIIWGIFGYNNLLLIVSNANILLIVSNAILAVLSFYFAFACASERFHLPGSKLLTADESTDFKASGSVLGYMLFAFITGGYALHYLIGETVLPLATFQTMELICGILMVFAAILLLTVGKMRFTPIMFLLIGLTNIIIVYSTGYMFIGIGILFIAIGLFAMLRKESRILPGIMLIFYGCTDFFSALSSGAMVSVPVVSVILNAIPCLIAIYLSFVVYSQRKLPKF